MEAGVGGRVGGSKCCVDAILLHQKERQALNLWKKLQCLAIAISALMLLSRQQPKFSHLMLKIQCLMSDGVVAMIVRCLRQSACETIARV